MTGVRKLMDERMNGRKELEVRWKDEGVQGIVGSSEGAGRI